jgi:dihydroorotate dehydrogenase (fumarate)
MKTTIAGIETDYVGTASGCHDTTDKQVHELAAACNFFTLKSCTLEPRIGNVYPRYADLPNGTIQSMGLPNRGLVATLDTLNSIKDKYGDNAKVKASIAGFSLKENIELMAAFKDSQADFIEINVSCPNTDNKVLAHNIDRLDDYLVGVMNNRGRKPIGLKLPFYGDKHKQDRLVDVLIKHRISFITAINSIPGLWINTWNNAPVIAPNNGTGGIGGSYIMPFALNECRNYYNLLKGTGISLIGCGGISSGIDAYSFLLAGCDAVEVGSYLERNRPSVIPKINDDLWFECKIRGHDSIDEVKGKLKPL